MKYAAALLAFLVVSCAHMPKGPATPPTEAQRLATWLRSTVTVGHEAGTGSGTVVWSDPHSGTFLVLTCAHVVHELYSEGLSPGLYVENPELGKLSAEVEKYDDDQDLALLGVAGPWAPPAIPVAQEEPELYSRLYLLGSPMHRYGSISEAFLASKHYSEFAQGGDRYYVTGGLVLFGISGGTALNARGELVGVPEAVLNGYTGAVPQMGFLVSLPEVRAFLKGYSI